jgi:hypothetical protein
MRMNTTHSLLVCACILFLFACANVGVCQVSPRKRPVEGRVIDQTPKPQTPNPRTEAGARTNQRQREVQVTDKSKVNTEPPIPPNSIRVRIRYRKEYGFITTKWFNSDGPYSCHAFSVDGRVWLGEPGTFGRPKTGNEFDVLMTIVQPDLMREEGSYYVCGFTIEGVPLNELIIVKASMVANSKMLTSRWPAGPAGSQPQPPPGSERMILNGSSKVRLTRSDPTAILDFEMVYRPIQLPPR